ncbi:MAG: helix-turn-helix domain-containing protein [Treponema sp.]|nr:helix-turn-helix domain-containing protein [Treponema sp.]
MRGETFWARARPLIHAQNMSLKDYANYLNIRVNTLYSWIKHKRVPEVTMAYDIAVTLGVTLDYLLGGNETTIVKAREKELAQRRAARRALRLTEEVTGVLKEMKPLDKEFWEDD